MVLVRIEPLPADPLGAAAAFHAEWLPRVRTALSAATPGEDLVLAFPAADHTHRDWRLAAVRGLARDHAPRRINAVAGLDPQGLVAAAAYLGSAPGVTGQYLPLDGAGVGPVVGLAP